MLQFYVFFSFFSFSCKLYENKIHNAHKSDCETVCRDSQLLDCPYIACVRWSELICKLAPSWSQFCKMSDAFLSNRNAMHNLFLFNEHDLIHRYFYLELNFAHSFFGLKLLFAKKLAICYNFTYFQFFLISMLIIRE